MFFAGRQLLPARAVPLTAASSFTGVRTIVSAFAARRASSSSSSSKPSNSPEGPRGLSQATTGSTRRLGRKTPARMAFASSKAAFAKGTAAPPAPSLPYADSTEHMKPTEIAVSSFFAQHRPVATSHSFPLTFDDKHFESIFTQPRFKAPGSIARAEREDAEVETQVHHYNIDDTRIRVEVQTQTVSESSHQYLPFRPPPPPTPQESKQQWSTRQHKQPTKKAIAVVERVPYVRHPYEILTPSYVLSRMRIQQRKMEENGITTDKNALQHAEDVIMHALSVKRQRRLKMKKHKYKKLMKKTRNLRRRLENR